MKKYVKTFVAGALTLSISACNSNSKTSENPAETEQSTETKVSAINFKTAENYFVKNTVTETIPSKITTQADFDKYFGMATTMGDQGKPTPIDFNKEYVIVVDHASTNKKTELTPVSLTKKDADITLTYSMKHGEDIGFTMHPFLMIIVDKTNEGKVSLKEQ